MKEITIRVESKIKRQNGDTVHFSKPRFVIRESGFEIGKISIDYPDVAEALAKAFSTEVIK